MAGAKKKKRHAKKRKTHHGGSLHSLKTKVHNLEKRTKHLEHFLGSGPH